MQISSAREKWKQDQLMQNKTQSRCTQRVSHHGQNSIVVVAIYMAVCGLTYNNNSWQPRKYIEDTGRAKKRTGGNDSLRKFWWIWKRYMCSYLHHAWMGIDRLSMYQDFTYERGLNDCTEKGVTPLTLKEIKDKLNKVWDSLSTWSIMALRKVFLEFWFETKQDKSLAWSMRARNLQSGVLWLFKWSSDFNIHTQKHTHSQV